MIPLILFTSSRKKRWASSSSGLDEDARVDDTAIIVTET